MSVNYNNKIVTDGLVLCLDAGDRKSYSGSGTTWKDRSGNGNDGTLVNGVGYDSGNLGSLTFDGVDDGVIVGSKPEFLFNTGDSITAEAWVNPSNTNAQLYQAFFTIGGVPATSRDRLFQMRIDNLEKFGFLYRNSSNTQWQILETGSIVNNNTWYHVVSTYTYGTGSSWKVYVNGVGVSTSYLAGNGNANPIQPADTSVHIGLSEDGTTAGEQWLGKISISRLYNRALTEAEIQQNFNAQKSRFS